MSTNGRGIVRRLDQKCELVEFSERNLGEAVESQVHQEVAIGEFFLLFTLTPQGAVPTGTVGFSVKNTTGSFDYVTVN